MEVKFLQSRSYSLNGTEVIHAYRGLITELPEDWAKRYIDAGICEKAKPCPSQNLLENIKVTDISGIGPKTAKELAELDISNCQELYEAIEDMDKKLILDEDFGETDIASWYSQLQNMLEG